MKSQKTTMVTAAICLFLGMNAFAQKDKQKKERRSPEEVFERLDVNEDGKILKDEIKNERFLKRFDKIDTNSDGAITLDELTISFEKGKKGKGKGKKKNDRNSSPRKMFDELDVNNDGKVSKDEISNEKMLNRFDKIDTNSDGFLDIDELTKSMQRK